MRVTQVWVWVGVGVLVIVRDGQNSLVDLLNQNYRRNLVWTRIL